MSAKGAAMQTAIRRWLMALPSQIAPMLQTSGRATILGGLIEIIVGRARQVGGAVAGHHSRDHTRRLHRAAHSYARGSLRGGGRGTWQHRLSTFGTLQRL